MGIPPNGGRRRWRRGHAPPATAPAAARIATGSASSDIQASASHPERPRAGSARDLDLASGAAGREGCSFAPARPAGCLRFSFERAADPLVDIELPIRRAMTGNNCPRSRRLEVKWRTSALSVRSRRLLFATILLLTDGHSLAVGECSYVLG
jgi:hypothetical protein